MHSEDVLHVLYTHYVQVLSTTSSWILLGPCLEAFISYVQGPIRTHYLDNTYTAQRSGTRRPLATLPDAWRRRSPVRRPARRHARSPARQRPGDVCQTAFFIIQAHHTSERARFLRPRRRGPRAVGSSLRPGSRIRGRLHSLRHQVTRWLRQIWHRNIQSRRTAKTRRMRTQVDPDRHQPVFGAAAVTYFPKCHRRTHAFTS